MRNLLLAFTALMALATAAHADEVAFQVNQGEGIVSLYGLIDIDVANGYLQPQGLEAIEVAPGKALTGFTVNHYRAGTVQYTGLPTITDEYSISYLPFLVNKPGHELRNAYYFGETVTDGLVTMQLYRMLGVPFTEGSFGFSLNGRIDRGPHRTRVSTITPGVSRLSALSRLLIGRSRTAAWESNNGNVIEAFGVTPNAVQDGAPRTHTISRFTVNGSLYSRAYDAKVDSYAVDPRSVQGRLFREGHFTPVRWQVGNDLDAVGFVGIGI